MLDFFKENDKELEEERLNSFFIKAEKHDRDRLEIQFGFDGRSEEKQKKLNFDVDVLLFAPKSLGLSELSPKGLLQNEFQSYLRLQGYTESIKSDESHDALFEKLNELRKKLSRSKLRAFATLFEDSLKNHNRSFKKYLKKIDKTQESSLSTDDILENFKEDQNILQGFRKLKEDFADLDQKLKANKFERRSRELDLLDEYLSHLYLQYLGSLMEIAEPMKEAQTLCANIQRYAKRERIYRLNNGWANDFDEKNNQLSSESYLLRISLLKKYFQRGLFIRVVEQSLENKILYLVYGLAAAIAASWAALVNFYAFKGTDIQNFFSASLIVVFVLAYVAKDIMKDYFRRFFLKTSSRRLPTVEKMLYIGNKKLSLLGKIKEFLRFVDQSELSKEVLESRYNGDLGDIEEKISSDVLHYRKSLALNLKKLYSHDENTWGIREIIRYRFDRLCASTEDAYKKIYVSNEEGKLSHVSAHKVYHLHLYCWIKESASFMGGKNASYQSRFKSFVITLDKKGLLSCRENKLKSDLKNPFQ